MRVTPSVLSRKPMAAVAALQSVVGVQFWGLSVSQQGWQPAFAPSAAGALATPALSRTRHTI
jgi:hypothetical protein